MSQEVINCLRNEMKISWVHFETKYLNFTQFEQKLIDGELKKMLDVSRSIKNGNATHEDFNSLFHEGSDDSLNEFLQAMFDCFKQWQTDSGIELHKSLYIHTNRSDGNWFPVVIIEQKINEIEYDSDYITVYRGCNQEEYETNKFQQRQSWTTDLSVAKYFAFYHPSNNIPRENRVVIETVIHTADILWTRDGESETVLRLGFSPKSHNVTMTYTRK